MNEEHHPDHHEPRQRPLKVERSGYLLVGMGLMLGLITFIIAIMQIILAPFFSGFFSQSIGGMGLK